MSDLPQHKNNWDIDSWKAYPILQQPEYDSQEELDKALSKVKTLPPLVHYHEIDQLKKVLSQASDGKMFLLQGGDCAERFIDCTHEAIETKFKILLQMSLIIIWISKIGVVRVARMAGQFAKPRSSPMEKLSDGSEVPSFKGDNINGFHPSERRPDPNRLVNAYFHSAATLNYLRGMIFGGVADLHSVRDWNFDKILSQQIRNEYEDIIGRLEDGLKFLSAIGAENSTLSGVDFYTSHEGLILNYEAALTKKVKDKYYNLGTHFLWIGDRTRQINGAHTEYFRGIENPIGIKCGPTMTSEDLVQLIKILNPNKEKGKLTIITRYGFSKVKDILPKHIKAVKESEIPVLWCCDPCHGNGKVTESGIKTRHLSDMMEEIKNTFEIHAQEGTILGGVHLELTGEHVTECIGGSDELMSDHLHQKYETFCDPRLNYTQSLDVAFHVAKLLSEKKK